ncbi:arginine-binding extracellular protein ArtP precursor [Clostridium tepidiprofundi DSM 19306]|uniref:Arginine-binding extracellular protein ArtP n=1 Tax=Clostridium tepidiprofundi DSM 19306 TaxID=1121338 RepID=A0A151B2Z6_9CLOT|nr:transporter substrate-binding domain-containing protein [Clostridium tepidiprofundi]KYH34281.1 arginine-binding extracellular protein ArtP precursor [Clostridium tepidiprofundi DSM 19306]
MKTTHKLKKFFLTLTILIISIASITLLPLGLTGCGQTSKIDKTNNTKSNSSTTENTSSTNPNKTNTATSSINSSEISNKVEQIKKSGVLVLGTSADYPPYEFHKIINGKDEIIGFDVDIAREIASDLGVKLKIKDMKFEGLLPSLQTGKIDIIIAGMTPSQERKKAVDFSRNYYQAEQKFLVRKSDSNKFKSIDDLKSLNIGVQKSTIQEKIAKTKIQCANVVSLGKITDLVLQLKSKKIDGIILEGPVATAYANSSDDLEVANINLGKEDGVAIAIKKGQAKLLDSINNTLERLIKNNKISNFIVNSTKLAEDN